MQPERASRGIAAVALSSAGLGVLLLVLALLLTACGSSSSASPTAPSTSGSDPAPTTSAATTPSAPATAPATAGTPTAAPATSAAAPTAVETVPTVPVTTAPAVAITAPAAVPGGGRITIGTITSIQGTAQLPGEIAGPAVRVPVTIVNGSRGPIDLAQVVVDLVDHTGVSAGQLSTDPAAPFTGTLAPGATANAVYVFTLPVADRSNVRIIVSYTTAAPVVVFTGTVA